jgi:hypothetical protein
MVLGHCLAPIGHGKNGINELGPAKFSGCTLVFKVVQQRKHV